MAENQEISVGARRLKVSNLGKILYPEVGFTKAQVIDYYVRIAPALLPHLRDRPLTMKRYPNGVTGQFFYEKRCPTHRPSWVKTASIRSEKKQESIDYCLCNDLPTLVWAANLADLELHTQLAKARSITKPTVLVFDLDPGAPADIVQCCVVALWIRALFEPLKIQILAKTSGSKGLQLYVPLNTPTSFDKTKAFALEVARMLERNHPDAVTSVMNKSLRAGKVFVDWSQNDEKKTTVCVYSLRARAQPTVSTPVSWDEVMRAATGHRKTPLTFTSDEALQRFERMGDLFAPVLKLKQRLPAGITRRD